MRQGRRRVALLGHRDHSLHPAQRLLRLAAEEQSVAEDPLGEAARRHAELTGQADRAMGELDGVLEVAAHPAAVGGDGDARPAPTGERAKPSICIVASPQLAIS